MDLIKLEKKLPLRAYPEETLNRVILMDLLPFLANLLSLTDEVSANRLEIALPAIKTSCIGMGFSEIKKMFEMYTDSKLNLKPIPNYFDRILLGKIVSEYKSLKSKIPKKIKNQEMSDKEKEFIMLEAIDRLEKEYKQNKKLTSVVIGVYDYLFEKGELPTDLLYKEAIFAKAKILASKERKIQGREKFESHKLTKEAIVRIQNGEDKGYATAIAKKLVLEEYFNKKQKK